MQVKPFIFLWAGYFFFLLALSVLSNINISEVLANASAVSGESVSGMSEKLSVQDAVSVQVKCGSASFSVHRSCVKKEWWGGIYNSGKSRTLYLFAFLPLILSYGSLSIIPIHLFFLFLNLIFLIIF